MNDILKTLEQPPPMSALFSENGSNITGTPQENGSVKVHLRARSRGVAYSPFFGDTVHDFSTMTLPPEIAIDDSHGNEIGKGHPYLTDYGIEVDGEIFPNPDNPSHASNRIIYNLKNGIPQQASIDFSGRWDAEILHEGMETEVNGSAISGFKLIIKNWTLRSVAICKEGVDESSAVDAKFSAALSKPESISDTKFALKKGETQMPDEKPKNDPAPEETPKQTKPEDENKKTETEELKAAVSALSEQVTALNKTVESMSQKMSAIPTKFGVPPVTPPDDNQRDDNLETLLKQYREISDPAEKTRFYRKHKDKMTL